MGRISHVGLVLSVEGATYSTIEGNTYDNRTGRNGDTVAIHAGRTHADPEFRGYGRPLYDDVGPGIGGGIDNIAPNEASYQAPPTRTLVPLRGVPLVTGTGALQHLRVSGTRLPTDITARVTTATLTFASTEKSSLQLQVQDFPTADIARSGLFARDYQAGEFGRPVQVDFGDQHMQVTAVSTRRGKGGPLHNVTCTSSSVGYLNSWAHKGSTTFGQITPRKWFAEIAANAGARSLIEDTPTGDVGWVRRPGQTTWDSMQELSKGLGWVCFEHDNTIFAGRPSWLTNAGARLQWDLRWDSWDRYSAGIDGIPIVDAALDDSNGDQMSFGLLSADKFTARPGQIVTVAGSLRTCSGLWLMDKVAINLLRSEVVQVTCGRIVDPTPEPITGRFGDLPTNGATGGATAGLPGQGG